MNVNCEVCGKTMGPLTRFWWRFMRRGYLKGFLNRYPHYHYRCLPVLLNFLRNV
jgi:hypothetical protein